jgi:hypothetical protein
MAITSYPRVTIQGTGPSQNPPNGQGLMLLNPSTNKYEPATASTFSGGGGGGDATAANQTTQIDEAIAQTNYLNDVKNNTNILTESNGFLDSISNQGLKYDGTFAAEILDKIRQYTESTSNSLVAYGKPNAEYLNDIALTLIDVKNLLTDIKANQTNGSQRNVIQDTTGNPVNVTDNKLNIYQ